MMESPAKWHGRPGHGAARQSMGMDAQATARMAMMRKQGEILRDIVLN
ncbi:hypothetical protein QQ054_04880 [Oscillatoria amoena NRMC-F 0135]|nr:hypothetical protein [Oscillatoria amoena NRMC-F 0135]